MLSMLQDFGWNVSGEVWGDASAALGIINRKGLGKTRHVEIGLLWSQQTAAERRLRLAKILGRFNLADLFAKPVWCKHCVAARAARRQHSTKGRGAIIAPDVDNGSEGPIQVSMDYMYFHERGGKNSETRYNPPHLIAIEHRHGRRWAYQVPNKGTHEKAS